MRVVDPEQGQTLPPNTEGMVLVKGPNVMKGYLGRDDLTERALRDGWYVTGDLGVVDEDGFLKITGRLSRFSKIGGEMVPHGRIEEALNESTGSDEPAFAVTAVGDGRGGERLAVLHTVGAEQVDKALESPENRRPPQPVPAAPGSFREGRCPADAWERASSICERSSGSRKKPCMRSRPPLRCEVRRLGRRRPNARVGPSGPCGSARGIAPRIRPSRYPTS